MRRPLALALGAALASTVLALLGAPTARAQGRDWTGQQAPEVYVQRGLYGLPSGSSLASFRGRVVVLKFFFTECPTCRGSLPEFQRLYSRFGSRAQFVAVAYDSASNVEDLWRRSGYSIPVAVDESGIAPKRYGVVTYPTNYVIGPDGTVRAYDDVSDGLLEREISRAAAVAPVVVPAGLGAATAAAERNVRELGDVPTTLSGVVEAARENDYGAVLRVVERHLDLAADTAAVVAAARRIEAIAKTRYRNRLARIESRRALPDVRGAHEMLVAMAEDFHDTQFEAALAAQVAASRTELERAGSVAAR